MSTVILFHGSPNLFEQFEIKKELARFDETTLAEGFGIYLTEDYSMASNYGTFVYEVQISKNDITDMTKKKSLEKLLKNISKDVNVNFESFIDLEMFYDSVLSGKISTTKLFKEINDLLDSEVEFYDIFGDKVTYEEDCILKQIEQSFYKHVKDIIKYYDNSFNKDIYICHRNPEKLKIIKVHN